MSETENFKGSETVLVVDDDEDARRAMRRTLDFHGYTALDASDAGSAIEVLEKRGDEVDLVVVDVVMPDVDGVSLAERIADRFPDTRILFTSGYPQPGIPEKDERGEKTHFVKKPMTIRELIEKVRAVLDGLPE